MFLQREICNMKLSLLFVQFLTQSTLCAALLNEDLIFNLTSDYFDDKTVHALSSVSHSLNLHTQSRLNGFKLEAIKRVCPSQYFHLTNHGHSILQDIFIPDLLSFPDDFEMKDKQKEILGKLNQKRACIKLLYSAKHLIGDKLESITIALPAYSTQRLDQYGVGYYNGSDSTITECIKRYFTSIKQLVNTGLIKKVKIESVRESLCSLHPALERMLYKFLASLKVQAMHFSILLENRLAFNEYAMLDAFALDISYQTHDVSLTLPNSTRKLTIELSDSNLSNQPLPNLQSVDVISKGLSDLTIGRPHLDSIAIRFIRYDSSFIHTICSRNNGQIKSLKLDFRFIDIDVNHLMTCLLSLKPTLKELSFHAHGSLAHTWDRIARLFLKNNSVLTKLAIELEDTDSPLLEINFLRVKYEDLALETLDICIDGKEEFIVSIQHFIESHSSLKSVSFRSRMKQHDLTHLSQLLTAIKHNPTITDIQLEFETRIKREMVGLFMQSFADKLDVLKGREIRLNGVSIARIIEDFSLKGDENMLSCYRDVEMENDECVLIFSPIKDE